MISEDTVYENGLVWLPKKHFSEAGLKAALTFDYGSPTYGEGVTTFEVYQETPTHVGVPRHFLTRASLERFLSSKNLKYEDNRPKVFDKLDIRSKVILDKLDASLTVQRDAVGALTDDGILSLACGIGKTPVALHHWATNFRTPLVVLADNTSILEHWEEMIRLFVEPANLPIGKVYDGKSEWDRPVVLASVQSVYRAAAKLPADIRRKFGLAIIDEIHKVAAPVYSRVAPLFTGRRLGLTATPERSDGLEEVYQFHYGPVRFKYLRQPLAPRFYFYTPKSSKDLMAKPQFRNAIMNWRGELNIQKVWTALARHDARTKEIADLIKELQAQGRRVLVISQRKQLLQNLNNIIPPAGLIISATPLTTRTKVLANASVVLGIMGIAKEGLDAPTLDTLVICEPFKDDKLFQQITGRILRDHPEKGDPKVVIVQDDLGNGAGPVYGLARSLKRVIEKWPPEKGGPYYFEPYPE